MPVSRRSQVLTQHGTYVDFSSARFQDFLAPFWSVPGAHLYLGDVRECLRKLPTRSVHCVVTSPPYHGLRDYGTGTWEGGSAECDHIERFTRGDTNAGGKKGILLNSGGVPAEHKYKYKCLKCGAVRTDHQLGMEDVADCLGWAMGRPCGACYVCHMVEVFGEVRRVLRDDGTVWLSLGDTFDNGQGMVPAAVAMALRADGWRLVQDIIWYAPNKMPESVTNRCTKSHEHIFLLAKGPGYYYDSVAIGEPGKSVYCSSDFIPKSEKDRAGPRSAATSASPNGRNDEARSGSVNKRDVWIVPTQGYTGAHFAVFSPRLITPCILAGTSEHGCCAECGAPYERVVSKSGGQRAEPSDTRDRSIPSNRNGITGSLDGVYPVRNTVGWRKACGCRTADVAPCIVLDPFVGSGTTVATSIQLGRAGAGIDLSEKYLEENAIPRIEAALRGEKVGRKTTAIREDYTSPSAQRLRGQ